MCRTIQGKLLKKSEYTVSVRAYMTSSLNALLSLPFASRNILLVFSPILYRPSPLLSFYGKPLFSPLWIILLPCKRAVLYLYIFEAQIGYASNLFWVFFLTLFFGRFVFTWRWYYLMLNLFVSCCFPLSICCLCTIPLSSWERRY